MSDKEVILYPDLNPMDFAKKYGEHVNAMTAEKLHSKSDIATQLAWRDVRIEELIAKLASVTAELEEAKGFLPAFLGGSPLDLTPLRNVYVCKSCQGTYADSPVSSCDCMTDTPGFLKGIILLEKNQPNNNQS